MNNVVLHITNKQLQLQFEDPAQQAQFVQDMVRLGLNFFTKKPMNQCVASNYSDETPYGFFVSEHGRVGLNFPSEQQKFQFKEYIGLDSECFMDMGRGYESQMHFNERKLPFAEGAEIVIGQVTKR